jgi:hypothetical protein
MLARHYGFMEGDLDFGIEDDIVYRAGGDAESASK